MKKKMKANNQINRQCDKISYCYYPNGGIDYRQNERYLKYIRDPVSAFYMDKSCYFSNRKIHIT